MAGMAIFQAMRIGCGNSSSQQLVGVSNRVAFNLGLVPVPGETEEKLKFFATAGETSILFFRYASRLWAALQSFASILPTVTLGSLGERTIFVEDALDFEERKLSLRSVAHAIFFSIS